MCATDIESNLIAMGFEVTSNCAVAYLPDGPLTVQRPSVKTDMSQVPVKPANKTVARAVANKPMVAPGANDTAGGDINAKVSSAATDVPQRSLYEIIRQRSQLKISTQKEESTASSSGSDDSVLTRNSDVEIAQHPQREPSVKFCLEQNAFISASSAEESQCR